MCRLNGGTGVSRGGGRGDGPVQWLRSLAFNIQMYVAMAVMALAYAPLVLADREWAFRAVHAYCRWVRWTAGWMIGLRSEIRGEVPVEECLIAAKHQSFFDIILIVSVVPRPKFIMKKELVRAPFVGWYARQIGCIPVDRGRRGQAVQKMLKDVEIGRLQPGQLIIYPQGTRVAAGVAAPYKAGHRDPLQGAGAALLSGRHQCRRVLAAPGGAAPPRAGRGRVPAADPVGPRPRRLHGRAGAAGRGRLGPADVGGGAGVAGPRLRRQAQSRSAWKATCSSIRLAMKK